MSSSNKQNFKHIEECSSLIIKNGGGNLSVFFFSFSRLTASTNKCTCLGAFLQQSTIAEDNSQMIDSMIAMGCTLREEIGATKQIIVKPFLETMWGALAAAVSDEKLHRWKVDKDYHDIWIDRQKTGFFARRLELFFHADCYDVGGPKCGENV